MLGLDYGLEHPRLPWLPTEVDRVAAFDALGIERGRFFPNGSTGARSRASGAPQGRSFCHGGAFTVSKPGSGRGGRGECRPGFPQRIGTRPNVKNGAALEE